MIKPRILIVDDDREILDKLGDFLQLRMNSEVVTIDNGADALQSLDQGVFHVLLQDLHMPGIDGYAVLRHAKRIKPDIIAVVITRLDSPSEIKLVEDLGAVYLSKPFEMKTVQLILERKLKSMGEFDFQRAV